MAEAELPLILFEGLDVYFFDSPQEACAGLEAYDVEVGAYRGFDSSGRPLLLSTTDAPHEGGPSIIRRPKRVSIQVEALPNETELRDLLIRHLKALGRTVDTGMQLGDLVQTVRGGQGRRPGGS